VGRPLHWEFRCNLTGADSVGREISTTVSELRGLFFLVGHSVVLLRFLWAQNHDAADAGLTCL
jgi:hypothetical protein